ncbi:UDP-N-acetylglucosamine--N-acetylmuramyl-(pentapeptide) pyrophosphoryl-undecaprenol N-acetylglucosamine transferase [Planctomycetaceae bacterium]|nr:UDP-N-acetylglucosamine--N-acetylmuramyl-(pentapeptide) pyrophosphoryl-undecaprenol N-acetylglucosamine transferase [Planctomycetaceae bacterium]
MLAGGGTGGHLYPAIAIADAVRSIDKDAAVLFIGTKGRIEERVVPERGYDLALIWISGVRRSFSFATALVPVKVVTSLVQSFMHIRRFKPDVVVGTGGYVSGPPVYMATLLGIPTVLQEQNSYPGVTTRLLATRVRQVHVMFERTKRFLKRQDNILMSGNPVRTTIGSVARADAAARLGLDPAKQTLLVTGGSQGAASMNAAVLDVMPALAEAGVQVLWLTGQRDAEKITAAVSAMPAAPRGAILPYLERMEDAFAVADLMVSRAGASTLAEIACAGVPSVLVPLPTAAGDHQTENAKAMVEAGAAVLCTDATARTALRPLVMELFHDAARRARMSAAARSIAQPDASMTIARAILGLTR